MTFWFDPLKFTLVNLTTHMPYKGVWIKSESKSIVDKKQPEISQSKNCTAAVTHHGLRIFPWMVVDCDTQYEAAFVCQNIKSHHTPVKPLGNRTCEGDWFMIDGSDNCFSVFWPEVALSFLEAQDTCAAYNSSVLNVDVMYRNISKSGGENLKRLVLGIHDATDLHFLHSVSYTKIHNLILGKILASNSGYSHLPSMITTLTNTPGDFKNIVLFAYVNRTCNVIERSLTTFILDQSQSEERRGVGIKCRSCFEPTNVTSIICEKDSKPYIINCLSQHFKCNDGTCIVIIYRCDSVNDCFDGSDEDHCHIHINNITSVNYFVTIPYLLQAAKTNIMPIHSICDGIYSNKTLRHEEDICFEYKIKQINMLLSATKLNLYYRRKTYNIRPRDIELNQYIKEKRLCLKIHDNVKTHINNTHHLPRDLPLNTIERSRKSGICTDPNYSCIVGVDKRSCVTALSACVHFSCPGMFKCHRYHCIYMSSVCDGQYDCKEGDDETLCPLSSCPGLLKCRGENRCLSKEEICDKTVNCLHSMDDEIICNNCPLNCKCSGYTMTCRLENSLEQIFLNGTYYTKGLILKGVQKQLFLHSIFISRLVYLNASYCGIKNIVASNIKYRATSYIIIASFLRNELIEVIFLSATIFKNIIFLDLSFNRLSIFMYDSSLGLEELLVLILRGNPLTRIVMNQAPRSMMLYLVDLQNIYHYSHLYIVFTKYLNSQIEVKVSDLLMCCILNQNLKCAFNEMSKICIGLFGSGWSRITFYSISTMIFFISLMVNITNIIQIMTAMVVHSTKKYYWIASFNNSISEILTSMYFFSLLVADAIKVNVLFWILSPICLILKLICYISILTMVVFRTHLLFCVCVKILYPFKHQNGYLKWTLRMTLVVWIIALISSFSTFMEELQQDEICFMVKCSTNSALNLLLYMTCVTQTLTIISCILIIRKVYRALEENNTTWAELQTKQIHIINSFKVILKITRPIILQLPVHFCIFGVLIFKLADLESGELYCQMVVLFVLPVSVLFSFITMYWK